MASHAMALEGMLKVGSSLLGRCVRPCTIVSTRGIKNPMKAKIPNRRKAPGLGIYPGQISNYDTNDIKWFPCAIPNIPFDDKEKYEPSKLLVVWRNLPSKGQAYWLRKIMIETLKLDDKTTGPAIVPNTPENNLMLWHVKHLITIKPLTFPNGIPTMDDLGATYIKQNGEMVINKKLQVPLEMIENPPVDERRMDIDTMKKHLELRWNNPWDT